MLPTVPDLTITVVSWNTASLLRACLRSIEESNTHLRIEIHVVDNASTDSSVEMVKAEFPQVRLFVNQENVGFARANNQSWNEVKSRYWMLLNSDAELRPDALEALVSLMEREPKAGLATARLVNSDGSPQHCAQAIPGIGRTLLEASRLHKFLPAPIRGRLLRGPYWTYDATTRIDWTWGTALIARREAVNEVGPLAESFFMYGEDLEWCLRMRRHGWEIWFCSDAEVLHHGGQSSSQVWDNRHLQFTIMDGVYKALRQDRGAVYVYALQLVTLGTLGFDWFLSRLRGRVAPEVTIALNYHKQAILWSQRRPLA